MFFRKKCQVDVMPVGRTRHKTLMIKYCDNNLKKKNNF